MKKRETKVTRDTKKYKSYKQTALCTEIYLFPFQLKALFQVTDLVHQSLTNSPHHGRTRGFGGGESSDEFKKSEVMVHNITNYCSYQ